MVNMPLVYVIALMLYTSTVVLREEVTLCNTNLNLSKVTLP